MVALLKMPSRMKLSPSSSHSSADRADHEDGSGDMAQSTNPFLKAQDRRVFPRKELHARIEGRRMDHALSVYKQPTVSLAVRDVSAGGLSAISTTPLLAGERVTVFFPPRGIMRGWDAYGRIIRCEPSAIGYRVAVAFDALPAA